MKRPDAAPEAKVEETPAPEAEAAPKPKRRNKPTTP